MFGGPSEHFYSHRNDVPVDRLAEFARAYGLQAVIQDIGFSVSNVDEI